MPAQLNPLPTRWYVFFGIVEPLSTLAGAYHAILNSNEFYHELVPTYFKSSSGQLRNAASDITGGMIAKGQIPEETKMGLAQLGSCYLLLAMLSAFMFPTVRKHLLQSKQPNPAAAEKIISATLLALGIADWIHIGITLHFLPPVDWSLEAFKQKLIVLTTQPRAWNGLLFGNIVVTLLLFVMRSLWFAGAGRQIPINQSKKSH
ncbi:unnamed protein product [Sympodiomycopsis kandeliae]